MSEDKVWVGIADTSDAFHRQFWDAFDRLFAEPITDVEREAAKAAAEAEFAKWRGSFDWSKPMAATLWAALEGLDQFRKT